MNWQWSLDGWIVIAGILSAASCALLGNFLVLRRMSMMGDAISHAVLPGLAIAFLLFDSRGAIVMFAGAVVAGVATVMFTQWLHQMGKVDQNTSMGVVFTSLFAIGLILIVRALDHVDLDPGCVLYGAIETVPMHQVRLLSVDIPRGIATLAPILLVDGLFVCLFYKELKITSFDPDLATALGINATVMHYLLMILVAATAVAAFESVGSILVIAMLIVPAATAYLLTDRLGIMILLSLAVAVVAAVLGHIGATAVPAWFGFGDTSTAGMMTVVAGAIFAITMVAAPRYGLASKLAHQTALKFRITCEDILGVLYRVEEYERSADAGLIRRALRAAPFLVHLALTRLRRQGKIERKDGSIHLTTAGRAEGRGLIRSHRLWECFLHEQLGLDVDHLHVPAMQLEHITDDQMQRQLDEKTRTPDVDPQGKPIPQASESHQVRGCPRASGL